MVFGLETYEFAGGRGTDGHWQVDRLLRYWRIEDGLESYHWTLWKERVSITSFGDVPAPRLANHTKPWIR